MTMRHGHGGFHGGRGGRFFGGFGGYGGGGYDGGYPYPVPIVPIVIETPSFDNDNDNGNDNGNDNDHGGTSVGYERGSRFFKRKGHAHSLVDAAKVIIPAPTNVQLTTELLGTNLAIVACIDGKCYRGVADLSGILADLEPELIERARSLHRQFHEQSDTAYPARHQPLVGAAQAAAINAVQSRVNLAGEALVGALLAEHHATVCAGWWHSLTHSVTSAVKGIGHGVSSAASGVGHAAQTTLKTLGPVIAVAAAGAATAWVGPEAGPIAASLSQSLVNAATGSGSVADVANQAIASATQAAQSDPTIKQALDAAHMAVAQTTAAAHVAQTIQSAANGNAVAKQQVLQLTTAAAQGDPAAQGVVSAAQDLTAAAPDIHAAIASAANATNAMNANGGYGDDSDTTVSGASLASGASQLAAGIPGNVVGVVQHDDGNWSAQAFPTSDDADDWFGQWLGLPHAFRYVAYFDKSDTSWPGPLNEQVGRAAHVAISGWPAALLAGGAGFAIGRWGADLLHRAKQAWSDHTTRTAA